MPPAYRELGPSVGENNNRSVFGAIGEVKGCVPFSFDRVFCDRHSPFLGVFERGLLLPVPRESDPMQLVIWIPSRRDLTRASAGGCYSGVTATLPGSSKETYE